MGALTEQEIFDCLDTNLALAIEHCENLARLPLKGPSYSKLRDCLGLIEGACRQASAWREDTRWLTLGFSMAEAHKRAGDWLRGPRDTNGVRIKLANAHALKCFTMLATNLRVLQKVVEATRHGKTGRVGMILPAALPAPHRDTRPSRVILPPGMAQRKSGLILPSGMGA